MSGLENQKGHKQNVDIVLNWVPPTAFGRERIQYDKGKATSLRVSVSGEEFNLPRLDVGPPDQPDQKDTIFYLNISPNPDTEFFTPGLYESAVQWYAGQIVAHGIRVLVIPPSHKSTEALHEAVSRAQQTVEYDIRVIDLVGGKQESDVALAQPDLIEHYAPITTPSGKSIGMIERDAAYLSAQTEALATEGKTLVIWIGDDVVSTGETLKAIKKIIVRATNGQADVYVLVIAIEAPDDTSPPHADSHTVAAMSIVEIKGGMKEIDT